MSLLLASALICLLFACFVDPIGVPAFYAIILRKYRGRLLEPGVRLQVSQPASLRPHFPPLRFGWTRCLLACLLGVSLCCALLLLLLLDLLVLTPLC